MPELRQDLVTGRWVAIARNRLDRPQEFYAEEPQSALPSIPSIADHVATCPFCQGNEARTPHEILADRPDGSAPDTAGWRVRVIPNQYPAVERGASYSSNDHSNDFTPRPAEGSHEVIIESPHHLTHVNQLSASQWHSVVSTFRDRLRYIRLNSHSAFALVFKNSGPAAGASIAHVHSQILALPVVPNEVERELVGARAFQAQRGQCVFCYLASQERAAGVRIVDESPHFVAFCPFASRFAFETWIVPKRHARHFDELGAAQLAELAPLWHRLLARLEGLGATCDYNFFIHTAPFNEPAEFYHWHIEITPRFSRIAGFEIGTGMHINALPPEEAALRLRAQIF